MEAFSHNTASPSILKERWLYGPPSFPLTITYHPYDDYSSATAYKEKQYSESVCVCTVIISVVSACIFLEAVANAFQASSSFHLFFLSGLS